MLSLADIGDMGGVKQVYDELHMHDHVKAKILYLYFPEKFLNVFSSAWIRQYCRIFGLTIENDSFRDRLSLMEFKAKDTTMSKWTTHQFMEFLTESFPPSNKIEKEIKQKGVELNQKRKELTGIIEAIHGKKAAIARFEKIISIGLGFDMNVIRGKLEAERTERLSMESKKSIVEAKIAEIEKAIENLGDAT
jgi:hypothetical protein